ncbi:MAG: thiamine-monophosphate kinase [Phycisphaerae bacterium]|nr:thiamine-monophosphate kinase [Phycisphaerae bacterium]
MEKGEDSFVAWIASKYPAKGAGVRIGIGDDMAMLRAPDGAMLVAADMLMDGVHFDTSVHSPEQIGRKALAVNLSDCAAMAVRPLYAVVSVALPDSWTMEQAQGLFVGMADLARRYDCVIVGGDTNSWARPLVVDVAVIAEPWGDAETSKRRNVETLERRNVETSKRHGAGASAGREAGRVGGTRPVRRDGMRVGDAVCVTGRLGGSLLGHHLDFEPRVLEARALSRGLGSALHAMMDLSDGLSTDGHRMASASGCGIEFDAAALGGVISDAAVTASREDRRGPMEHLFDDGEDFELLFAIDAAAVAKVGLPCPWARVGEAIVQEGLWLRQADGSRVAVKPRGWEHWTERGSDEG